MNWDLLAQFHFLRPWALLLLPVAGLIYWFIRTHENASRRWRGLIAPHLLDHLLVNRGSTWRIRPSHGIVVVLILCGLALSGPTWQREMPPFSEDKAPMVVALNLSRSMDAVDIQPTRLERAKQKIRDLLALRTGARTALYVYAKTAHMVLPLTDDPAIIEIFLNALSTDLIPSEGHDAWAALTAIDGLLAREEAPGTILFITDGIEEKDIGAFAAHGKGSKDALLVLGVGTSQGGPIRAGENSFATDSSGRRLSARLDVEMFRRLKDEADVPVMTATLDNKDVDWIQRRAQAHLEIVQQANAQERWRDAGYYLVLPLIPMVAFWFRRGWTVRWPAFAFLIVMLGAPSPAAAEFRIIDLFLTADQRGRFYFDKGDYATAAQQFHDTLWKGIAYYRAGDYNSAINQFALLETPEAYFYLGNCYARLGSYPQAVAAYDDALKRRPDFAEAKANHALVAALIPKKKDDKDEEVEAPNLKPDEVKFDEKGKKGKQGQIQRQVFTDDQMAQVWMRNIQTSPAGFLRRKFAIQASSGEKAQ